MGKVILDVVATKGADGHRVMVETNLVRGAGGLRAHDSANECTMLPAEGLVDQGHSIVAATTKNDGINWYTVGVFPLRVQNGALGYGSGETRVGLRAGIGLLINAVAKSTETSARALEVGA